jgi:DNA-binding PadR family transcriptional regulator
MSRGLGKIQLEIVDKLSMGKSLTVPQIKAKLSSEFADQHIRRALRRLASEGYVEYTGDWDDLHSEPKLWRLAPKGVRRRQVQLRITRALKQAGATDVRITGTGA